MLAATPQTALPFRGLGEALEKLIRPAVGFHTPGDVVKDPGLDYTEKRAILSSWASDACAVEGEPHLRWLLGSPEPVPLFEVIDAIKRLDLKAAQARRQPALPARRKASLASRRTAPPMTS